MQNIQIGFNEILKSPGSFRIKILKIADFVFGSLIAFFAQSKPDAKNPPEKISRILIIRPGGIGDAVLLIPILKNIRYHHPQIVMDLLCEKRNKEAFEIEEGIVTQVYLYDSLSSLRAVFKNHYDVVIDTEQWHYLSALVSYFLKSFNIGFATRILRTKLLNRKVPYHLDSPESECFKDLLNPLFPEIRNSPLRDCSLKISPEILRKVSSQVEEGSVAFFLGGSIPIRRLTRNQSLKIIEFLLNKGFPVVLLGGEDVTPIAQELFNQLPHENILNLVGKTSLLESAAIIQQCRFFIGPDSGLMHIACNLKVPIIAIFGPSNKLKWGPRDCPHIVISNDMPCSPCVRFSYTLPTCHKKYGCMRGLSLEQIFEAIQRTEKLSDPKSMKF